MYAHTCLCVSFLSATPFSFPAFESGLRIIPTSPPKIQKQSFTSNFTYYRAPALAGQAQQGPPAHLSEQPRAHPEICYLLQPPMLSFKLPARTMPNQLLLWKASTAARTWKGGPGAPAVRASGMRIRSPPLRFSHKASARQQLRLLPAGFRGRTAKFSICHQQKRGRRMIKLPVL